MFAFKIIIIRCKKICVSAPELATSFGAPQSVPRDAVKVKKGSPGVVTDDLRHAKLVVSESKSVLHARELRLLPHRTSS